MNLSKLNEALPSSVATRVEDTTFIYNSDVDYSGEDQYTSQLPTGRISKLPFQLPYSESGTVSVVNNLEGAAPDWIWVDHSSGSVTVDTSQPDIGVQYDFDIVTSVPPSTWTHTRKYVSISVAE